MGDEDTALVRRWQQGDPLAFDGLLRLWQPLVARLIGRLVPRQDAVPDLCQEVFIRVHRGRRQFRGESAFSTWLYRIAVNVVRDHGRRARPTLTTLNGHEPGLAYVPRDHAEAVELVAQALAGLPPTLREVVVLRHYEQMNFAEMARVTGTPASTLKSRFGQAMNRLRLYLEGQGIGPEEMP